MTDLLGWVGAFCFAVCAVPQAIKSYREGHSRGISSGFIWLWTVGEVCMLIYTIPLKSAPLIFNYLMNLIFLGIIIKYKYKERR